MGSSVRAGLAILVVALALAVSPHSALADDPTPDPSAAPVVVWLSAADRDRLDALHADAATLGTIVTYGLGLLIVSCTAGAVAVGLRR